MDVVRDFYDGLTLQDCEQMAEVGNRVIIEDGHVTGIVED